MTALINSTKRGFPTHENMQHALDEADGVASPPIRNAVPPPTKMQSAPALTPQFLLKQNQKLAEVGFLRLGWVKVGICVD